MNTHNNSDKQRPILSVRELSVDFIQEGKVTHAVKNISYEVTSGTTLGIVGESGSGKSVSSLAIMGLLPKPSGIISKGEIVFCSEDKSEINLAKLSETEMQQLRGKKIAMIFQEPMTSLNPSMRCGIQVMENILNHQEISREQAKERVLCLFKEVMLPEPERVFNAYPHQISGGQKQRVMIAMALSCNPDILIADEPTTALDVTVQKNILQLLKNIQQKHQISMIFISHNLDVIAEIADEVVVMYKGEVVEKGSIANIFKFPQHPYTQGLLACRPPRNERPMRLHVINDFIEGKTSSLPLLDKDRKMHHENMYKQSPILVVRNLDTIFITKRNFFGKALQQYKAVDNVSFEVFAGETLGLVGESGCGKTTLGRTIIRLIMSKSGSVEYKGIALNRLSNEEMRQMRKKLQIVFQDPYSSLNPRINIGEAIIEPMRLYNLHRNDENRKEQVEQLLVKVGLDPKLKNRYPHEFSGGQRQRVCIARALAVEPEFIICDESVSALDVSVQAQVLNLLNDLKNEYGLTYLFISHDLSVVRYMSDRIMVMQHGEIKEIGEADNIYNNPVSEYTQMLLDAIPKGIVNT